MVGEWKKVRLDEIGTVVTGKTPPGTLPEYFGSEAPFVTPTDMDGRRKIGETARSLSTSGIDALKRVVVPRGVAVSCIGWQMGKSVIIDRPAATNQQINTLVPVLDVADDMFVYYALTAQRDAIFRLGAGGSRTPILNKSGFESFEILLPPLNEQKAIALILGTLDDKIELNRRMSSTLEAMAQALFQSWFVDFGPVRAKIEGRQPPGLDPVSVAAFPEAFQDSTLGPIPEEWGLTSLYETARFINGAAFRNEDFTGHGDGLPVVKIAELKDGISAQTKYSKRRASSDQMIDTGDLLYSWSGSPDTSLDAFLWTDGPGLLNQHIFKVIAQQKPQKRFLYYLLKHLRPVLVETARDKQTTGLGHVTVADMKRLQVCWPSKPVLAAFDRLVGPIFDKAFSNSIENQVLAKLRDTLLPRLLSGQLRPPEARS